MRTGQSAAFLSLDQEKAYDWEDHDYLFGMLQAFIKVNSVLLAPIHFGRGLLQGCPMSGQLY